MPYANQEIERLVHDFHQQKDVKFLRQAEEVVLHIDPEAGKDAKQKEGLRRARLHDVLKLLAEVDAEFQSCVGPMYEGPVYLNVAVPGDPFLIGVAPESVKDPVTRKAYEDAIALNSERIDRKGYKMQLEMVERLLIGDLEQSAWESASARREIEGAVETIIEDPSLRARIRQGLKRNP